MTPRKKTKWTSTPAALRGNKPSSFTLPPDVRAAIEAEHERTGAPYSQIVAAAIRKYLSLPEPA